MHCRKKRIVKKLIVMMFIVALFVAGCLIYDVNKRFPDPVDVYSYTYDNPAEEKGLKITPIECRVYRYSDYEELYDYSGAMSGFNQDNSPDSIRAVTFKVLFENMTQEDIAYETDSFMMVAKNSGAHNGVLCEEGFNKSTIKPGEKQTFTLSTVIAEDSIVKKKWMDKLDSETYYLVYWWYPQVKRLEYEVSHE